VTTVWQYSQGFGCFAIGYVKTNSMPIHPATLITIDNLRLIVQREAWEKLLFLAVFPDI